MLVFPVVTVARGGNLIEVGLFMLYEIDVQREVGAPGKTPEIFEYCFATVTAVMPSFLLSSHVIQVRMASLFRPIPHRRNSNAQQCS